MATVKAIEPFGTLPDGRPVEQFEFNDGLCRMRVIALGGIVTELHVPDCAGNVSNITLNLPGVADYLAKTNPYFGAIIGRFGNRIANATFTLDGKTCNLPANASPNTLHGGVPGYDRVLWTPTIIGDTLRLSYTDPAGANGFPGTVRVVVTYRLSQGVWRIDYEATTDAATPVNFTQHAYFNLKDGGKSDILGHVLRVFAEANTLNDDKLIPTGQIQPLAGTPLDFRTARPIGRDFARLTNSPRGIDDNFILQGETGTLRPAAEVYEPTTGRTMAVFTTEPGMQVYTGNFLDGSIAGADGTVYQQHAGLCLETQHYPDSPNQPTFPNTILRPGETYRSTTEYRFGVR